MEQLGKTNKGRQTQYGGVSQHELILLTVSNGLTSHDLETDSVGSDLPLLNFGSQIDHFLEDQQIVAETNLLSYFRKTLIVIQQTTRVLPFQLQSKIFVVLQVDLKGEQLNQGVYFLTSPNCYPFLHETFFIANPGDQHIELELLLIPRTSIEHLTQTCKMTKIHLICLQNVLNRNLTDTTPSPFLSPLLSHLANRLEN